MRVRLLARISGRSICLPHCLWSDDSAGVPRNAKRDHATYTWAAELARSSNACRMRGWNGVEAGRQRLGRASFAVRDIECRSIFTRGVVRLSFQNTNGGEGKGQSKFFSTGRMTWSGL